MIDLHRAVLAETHHAVLRFGRRIGHPVAGPVALGIGDCPQVERIDSGVRRSAVTQWPAAGLAQAPGAGPWRDTLFEFADDEVGDLGGDVATRSVWLGHGASR